MSKTTILFNDRTRTFEITSKFFTDDFEKVLTQGKDQNLHLGKDNEVLGVNERVEKYFTDHFKLSINDEPIVLRFVGKEVESDLTYCYFEFFRAPQFTTLRVENSLLIDVFPDQQNIVDFTMNSSTNTMIFLKDKTSETIYR